MELLITVAALFAAIYAVVPRDRQLNLQLRVGVFDWIVVLLASILVLYLEFNDFFSARRWVFSRPWPTGVTPQNTIYLVLLAASAILLLRLRFKRLSRNKIGQFRELIEQLYWSESYGEVFTLLQNNLRELFRIAESNTWSDRIRNHLRRAGGNWNLNESGPLIDLTAAEAGEAHARHSPDWMRYLASQFFNFLPKGNHESGRQAQELISGILLSTRLVTALVTTRPYLGLDIIRQWPRSYQRTEFINLYITQLIRDTASAFYVEIEKNQNRRFSHRFAIPESNRLMHFLLSDAKFAHENGIYKPVGDYGVLYLDELARQPQQDPYNKPLEDVPDPRACDSPLSAIVSFFDIMVEEALHQGIQWHMWLYYMPSIVRGIVRNYRLNDPLVNPDSEFPNRYSFLLYRIFSALCDWVHELDNVPRDQANVRLASTRADHENGNIPKSSILALGESVRLVLLSPNLTPRFKTYLVDMAFDLYFKLIAQQELHPYANVLGQSLWQGGTYKPRNDQEYDRALIAAFEDEEGEYSIKHSLAVVATLRNILSTGRVA
jgi:hypothetical protein